MNKNIFALVLLFATMTMFARSDCDDKVFSSLTASKGTTISQMLDQLSYKCSFSIVAKDDMAEKTLNDKQLNTVNLRDFTLKEIFDFLLTENKLDYEYQNGILKISYLVTKTFKVDYVATKRTGTGTSGIQIGSTQTNNGNSGSSTSASSGSGASGTNIDSSDSFDFWEKIQSEITAVMKQTSSDSNSSDTNSTASAGQGGVIVNKVAGLITVTGSKDQVERADKYINAVVTRMHQQVLIDVQLLSVSMSKQKTTGIDWSQIYSLQNVDLRYGSSAMRNINTITFEDGKKVPTTVTGAANGGSGWDYLTFDGRIQINDIVKFLSTQGNVKSISNPKLLTLNNQPALISSGDQIFYTRQGTVVSGGTTSTTTASNIIESVFAGISLDITPEILDDDNIILKINPSVTGCLTTSQCQASTSVTPVVKSQPPDLTKKQISSVVKAKDGDKIILGGLIKDNNDDTSTKIPLLGDIPLLGYAFKQDAVKNTLEELVIIITPRIVKKDKIISLKDLGYKSELDK
ncbi:MAG: secretin N-terminal domain-containing protein [Campylobacterales bacterium]|nr:secretin N-terminal domain-containing protein [Campylobacterales bacterium]